jgi:Skp family chaperone for outer membrane proteins
LEKKLYELGVESQEEELRLMRELVADIRRAVAAVAQSEGCSVVVQSDDLEQILDPKSGGPDKERGPKTARELGAMVRQTPVLYVAPNADLTEKVLKKLNEDYRPSGARTAPPPEPK